MLEFSSTTGAFSVGLSVSAGAADFSAVELPLCSVLAFLFFNAFKSSFCGSDSLSCLAFASRSSILSVASRPMELRRTIADASSSMKNKKIYFHSSLSLQLDINSL